MGSVFYLCGLLVGVLERLFSPEDIQPEDGRRSGEPYVHIRVKKPDQDFVAKRRIATLRDGLYCGGPDNPILVIQRRSYQSPSGSRVRIVRQKSGRYSAHRVRIFFVCISPRVPTDASERNVTNPHFEPDFGKFFGIAQGVRLLNY